VRIKHAKHPHRQERIELERVERRRQWEEYRLQKQLRVSVVTVCVYARSMIFMYVCMYVCMYVGMVCMYVTANPV
jgi:hypothetical protein